MRGKFAGFRQAPSLTKGVSATTTCPAAELGTVAQPPSFQELVERHYAALYRFAFSLTRDEAEAADLTQQTFLIWGRKGHQLKEPSRASTWLFTTLHREYQRQRRRTEALAETLLDEEAIETPNPTADAMQEMDAAQVQEAMLGLADHHRVVLSLYYLTDHTYQEVAEIVGVPIGTIMSRLSRAKAELRRALADKLEPSPKRVASSFPTPVTRKERLDGQH